MTTQSIERIGQEVIQMLRAPDVQPLAELIDFPFSFMEDDHTFVLKTRQDLEELLGIYREAIREVSDYLISKPVVEPVGAMLYSVSFYVDVYFHNGNHMAQSRRVVLLGERGGKTKALGGMSLLECSTEWLAENRPEKLKRVQKWAS